MPWIVEGGSVICLNISSISVPALSRLILPSAIAILWSDPKQLIRTGNDVPVFSKSRAFPPDFVIRSVTSAISSNRVNKCIYPVKFSVLFKFGNKIIKSGICHLTTGNLSILEAILGIIILIGASI